MKALLSTLFIASTLFIFGQVASPDCGTAENVCANNGSTFPLGTGQGVVDINPGSNISNPSSNPQGVNSGCLLAGELNPNWFVINVGTSGNLIFTVGQSGGSGYYDWAMWPYTPSSCAGIFNNTLAPAACNWNSSAQGFTGMYPGTPPGGVSGNFQPTIPVVAGQAYVLMFSNYSSQNGFANLSFPPVAGAAGITCSAGTPDATICQGTSTTVTVIPPASATNPTYTWLVTNGVASPNSQTSVVTPNVTTQYVVQISDPVLPGGAINDTFLITVVPPPMPNAGPNQNVCLGSLISLSGTPDDPINNTTMWTYNASSVSPTPTVNFIPNNTNLNTFVNVNQIGTYYFMLQETNATCGPVNDTMVVTVSDLSVTAAVTPTSCAGMADGTITITSAGANEFSYNNGSTWVPNNTQGGFASGAYTVCARTAQGCQKCVTVNITNPPPMTIAVSNDTLICQNGTATMTATATGGSSFLYHWDHTSNTSAQQAVMPGGAMTYTVYAENQAGCFSPNDSINVTVRPPLTGTISAYDTVCPGYNTDLMATAVGGIGQPYSFVWTSGHSYTGVGTHTINVGPAVTTDYTVTITDGCESTPLVMMTNVRVAPLPVPMVNVLNPIQCEPAIFDIVNTTDPSLSQYTYWLVNGNQQFLNQDTITTTELWAGEYDLQLIVTSYEGCVDSTTWLELLSVDPKPIADFKYSPNPVLMFNTQVRFTNYSFNGYTYQWFFEDGMPSQSTQTNVDVNFPDGVEGRYDVMLITTSELGCVDTMIHELIVYPEVLIYAPNAFTPDGDEHNQNWRVYMEGIDVYDFELLIFNRWGEVVWESHDIEIGWDGTYGGKIMPSDTYTWIIRTKDLMNDAKYTFEGHINLLK